MKKGEDDNQWLLSFTGQRLCLQGTNSVIAWPVFPVGMKQMPWLK